MNRMIWNEGDIEIIDPEEDEEDVTPSLDDPEFYMDVDSG